MKHSISLVQVKKDSKPKPLINNFDQNYQLKELRNFTIEKKNILEKLLAQPKKPLYNKPTVNFKLDIETVKHQRDELKQQNYKLQKLIMGLKLSQNNLQAQNKRLKEFQNYFDKQTSKTKTDNLMIIQQRRKIMQLKMKVMDLENEISEMRKLSSSSTLLQYQIQNRYLNEQNIRLKAVISVKFAKKEQNDIQMCEQIINLLKQDNEKLKGTIRLLQNEKQISKAKKSIMKKQNGELKNEIQRLKQRLLIRQSQIQRIDHENKNLIFKKVNQYKLDNEIKQSQKIKELQKTLQQYSNQINKYKMDNQQIKQELKSLKQKQKNNSQDLLKTQHQNSIIIKILKQKNQSLEQQLKNLRQNYSNNNKISRISQININSFPSSIIKQKKILKPLKITQLYYQAQYLKILFRKYNLEVDLFFKNYKYSIKQLLQIFKLSPFQLPQQNAQKIARFLIQDNTKQTIEFDFQMTQKQQVINNALRTMISGYKVYNQAQIPYLKNFWTKIFSSKNEHLIKKIRSNSKNTKKFGKQQFAKILSNMYLTVNQKQLVYLQTQMFQNNFLQRGIQIDKLIEYIESFRQQQ